ncbi:MAG: UDP-N-acetylglucosamine 1-carboxyvinyltransferase [Candidatus Beckwithbacteria bacterium GW2011_GWB1_47_15]|uniref:UDP-N-acetylglucosamine 1-carboxyvinyltransferase n=1 Tax=Candidatus Beckwithbacteria bacterium GW2011_GWB1_47_15 TaxID=1618371 RepID=A0A0G1RWH7_9BACT|nr:MAG: UDP-N-acetylglucosamine1-carboxyvinyltransferase, UDP-N-acetylglucosamine 1-carboxyvinyltransferase [Candidatus Beckwithbacteria bacterium GW2011_GWC1_49_16]KKU35600.1 MAG: UDP-N-acetylglucosamine 1-carboxyvinyltransferase [Candidatus Beckwithbacteria bacterium GW2011_GWA1_46_30]KKU61654.1 MAG: UDP-N-acetylglucosamine 1-carboxyvinyltransferase [Candidatus Beckwithbacteria bacterium GW2011_GWB1_47_15]KKU72157.1 MAG: UDP-N-acetylglucosamine 1-carboxyvinyltransferase [Candidatus Beckwithbac
MKANGKLIIHGGTPLKGAVRLGGAKNASFKLMIAALLCPQEVRLLNFSRIADVDLTKRIITSLGAKVHSAGERTLFIAAPSLKSSRVPRKLGTASRASALFVAPLLVRSGRAIVPLPGGDRIGQRPLGRHLDGLKALGADIKIKGNLLYASCPKLTGATYTFAKNSHTGTETMIMASVLAAGKTTLKNAALEPEIDDLIEFLNQMGAKIKRKPHRVIEITGVAKLSSAIHQVMPDRNEAVSYALAALVTRGDVVLENARQKDLSAFLAKLKAAGGKFEVGKYGLRFYSQGPLKAVDVTTSPHPGFMTDWQPLWSVLATQSQGKSKIVETVFTSRFQFAADLKRMGAQIEFFDPKPKQPDKFYNFNLKDDLPGNLHGMEITGPTKLTGTKVAVTDIRAGATLALAGLAASGTTVLTDTHHLDRGYENFAGRLVKLGAKIS